MSGVLPEPEAITPAWVRTVLMSAFAEDVPPIIALSSTPIGAGNASDTTRLAITFAESTNLPKSLICKFHPRDEATRTAQAASGASTREAEAYRLVSARSACRTPKLYRIAIDGPCFNFVLEDLSERAIMGDQTAGCSLAQAEAVIDELASLHAAFADPEETAFAKSILRMADVANHWAGAIRLGASLARDRFGEGLSERDYAVIDRGAALAEGWLRHKQPRLSFTHGDPRADNIAFERVDGREHAILLDWQMAGLRVPMYDVGYFLTSSLPVPLRRMHECALVRRYLENTSDPDEARGFADYRFSLLANFSLTILAIAALPRTPTVDALLLTLLQRNIVAISDWDSLPAIELIVSGQA